MTPDQVQQIVDAVNGVQHVLIWIAVNLAILTWVVWAGCTRR
jgi:hypothetical protein